MKNLTSIFYITDNGKNLAERLNTLYPEARILKYVPAQVGKVWDQARTLIFIMASGIVVRTIAPLLKDKKTDPAVVVIDEKGRHVISLLSGHLGGANKRASEIAAFLGGEAVITTASDINDLPSIDIWAKENNLAIENWEMLPKVGTKLLNKRRISVYKDTEVDLPKAFIPAEDAETTDIIISNAEMVKKKLALYLRPKDLMLGIGCNSGTSAEEIEAATRKTLADYHLSFLSVYSISTIDIKKNEPGLVSFVEKYGLKFHSYSAAELNTVKGVTPSAAARKATGAQAVAEPAALLSAGGGKLVVPKQKIGNVTVAVAKKSEERPGMRTMKEMKTVRQKKTSGKIFVVGTGPGSREHITPYAQKAIKDSEAIVGYGTYLDLIQELIKGKEVVSTGMTQEIDRCKKAIELAEEGKSVAVISGGDPGIYAMAGLVLELLKNRGSESTGLPTVEVVPGISALNACASRLGAPLMHDFASISLSDRLTQWETIEKRLDAAAAADFVIALYNPKSKGRTEHINTARNIVMNHRTPDTPVGIVKAAMRENESVIVTDLEHMLDHEIDMQTTVIIGNSKTLTWNNLMITPRGYEKKRSFRDPVQGK